MGKECNCNFCKTHNKYCWSVIMECGCGCHNDGFSNHDAMCCALPNVLKANNPHKKLAKSTYYHNKLRKMEDL